MDTKRRQEQVAAGPRGVLGEAGQKQGFRREVVAFRAWGDVKGRPR